VNRPAQTNCRNEPSYPDHVTCIMVLSAPALTAHRATELCPIECPHSVTLCGEWTKR
jgi:hypothetical protein